MRRLRRPSHVQVDQQVTCIISQETGTMVEELRRVRWIRTARSMGERLTKLGAKRSSTVALHVVSGPGTRIVGNSSDGRVGKRVLGNGTKPVRNSRTLASPSQRQWCHVHVAKDLEDGTDCGFEHAKGFDTYSVHDCSREKGTTILHDRYEAGDRLKWTIHPGLILQS